MKKNAMLKIAAVVLVAVLLTTCAISSTFAKYASSGDAGTASARVAKWGVDVTTVLTTNNLFATSYGEETNGDATDKLVITDPAGDGANLIAPGTSKSLSIANFATGKPEVSGKITLTADVTLGSGFDAYLPLVFKVGDPLNPTTVEMGSAYGDSKQVIDAASFAEALEEAIATAGTVYFAPNTDLSTFNGFDISWEWPWDGVNYEDDNKLGNGVADGNAADYTITITLSTNIEQTGAAVA